MAAVGRHAPVEEIMPLMRDRQVSTLPVLEGAGRVVGVVYEADAPTAENLMPSPAVTVRADATLAEAAHTMA
ncbi:hypothetical protein M878_42880 [Streptomyces roseochromogenus subsp. oscitans DS 12.976]|uniref:CBS domain-containing protein n=1 Tax=Streptomyces roseochromogenus subsp. oscitans DS 12.976 TaxID=1352936 RepID=V6JH14_STRRC|nr:hypothetical protein M878_42880 [Streptomyces roseochromogenus subsp. oscitans DS 12.976]